MRSQNNYCHPGHPTTVTVIGVTQTGSVTATATTSGDTGGSSSHGAAIGAGVGVPVGVILAGAVAFLLWRRRRHAKAIRDGSLPTSRPEALLAYPTGGHDGGGQQLEKGAPNELDGLPVN